MKTDDQKQKQYLREWRQKKYSKGWKDFSLLVPPELHELLHRLASEWKYKNKHLYRNEEK